jgi:hypothetical protein
MPDKLPVLKAKEVVRALQRAGFYIHHQGAAMRDCFIGPGLTCV